MSTRETSFFRRIDIYFPWLKLVAVLVLGALVILDLLDLTISKAKDPENKIKIAPMSKHVRATNRNLKGKKLVVLTFDDGPSPATTPKILDILAKKDVPATFFMLGTMAKKNPDLVKRIKNEGHEVANHTMYHQNLTRISSAAVKSDVNESKETTKKITGSHPALTRPPYGNYNNEIGKIINTPLILWSVDTEDWLYKNTKSIVSTAMGEIYDGAIILMHDIYPTSVDALPELIDTIRKAGYEFASVEEITKIRNIKLANGRAYYNFTP